VAHLRHTCSQLRRPGWVRPGPRLTVRRALSLVSILQSFGRVVAPVQIGERFAIGVTHDIPAGNGLGAPGRREAAGLGLPCSVVQSALTVFGAAKDALAECYWSLAWRSGTEPLSEELA
jgi:hypothetical protein